MDYQLLFNFIGGLASVGLGWFAQQLWSAMKDMRSDLAKFREEIPQKYVAKDDYKTDIGRIHELLDKIYDRIAK